MFRVIIPFISQPMLQGLLILNCLLCLSYASANEALTLKTENLVGQSTLKVFAWEIYHSELYTEDGRYDESTDNYVLKITYLRDITQQQLIKQTYKQLSKLGVDESIYQRYDAQLKQLWPDVSKGDSLSAHIQPTGTDFYFNGNAIGSVKGADFGPMFGSIWLSPNTSQPDLRKQLIGAL
ncbi:chalcone isomerase family protein [Reinekea thalattae]|uniref:Chalcone isomerase domain-containing protein n=1 Tax=Reinekea thalattae TaxID=2593301 RepID=A0A5C8ZC60_9GAMM|nr:chalcone isomerase family protein [Reinekea thalattae]TXR54879.1 hypothetical protein FME95_10195 [Reinekea thalattae]